MTDTFMEIIAATMLFSGSYITGYYLSMVWSHLVMIYTHLYLSKARKDGKPDYYYIFNPEKIKKRTYVEKWTQSERIPPPKEQQS